MPSASSIRGSAAQRRAQLSAAATGAATGTQATWETRFTIAPDPPDAQVDPSSRSAALLVSCPLETETHDPELISLAGRRPRRAGDRHRTAASGDESTPTPRASTSQRRPIAVRPRSLQASAEVATSSRRRPPPIPTPNLSARPRRISRRMQADLDRRIQSLADRLSAATPGTAEVDEIDIELVAMLDREKAQLRDALVGSEEASATGDSDLRWRAVDVHGTAALAADAAADHGERLVHRGIPASPSELRTGRISTRLRREARTACLPGPVPPRLTPALHRRSAADGPRSVQGRRHPQPTAARHGGPGLRPVGAPAMARMARAAADLDLPFADASVGSKRRAQRLFRWGETIGPWALFLITICGPPLGPRTRRPGRRDQRPAHAADGLRHLPAHHRCRGDRIRQRRRALRTRRPPPSAAPCCCAASASSSGSPRSWC